MTPDKEKKLFELTKELKKIRDENKKRAFVKGDVVCLGTSEDVGEAQAKERDIENEIDKLKE